jgi:putative flippase GtrA
MIQKFTKHLIVRYLISGSTSAMVNLALFFVLHHMVGVYYIAASIVAFIVSFLVSLFLQKFWTFRDHSLHKFHHQVGKYLLTSLFGLLVDIMVLYVCVEYFSFHPFLGQIVAGLLTACCTFFLSRNFVFKKHEIDLSDSMNTIKLKYEITDNHAKGK